MDRLGGFFGSRDADDRLDDDDFVEEDDADLGPPPSPVGQDERRMQVRAYNHWSSLLGERNFPDVADLEPQALDDFGPHSVLLDLSESIEDPRVAFVGSELALESDHTALIDRLSEVPGRSVLSRITDHYMQILANQAPIGFEAEYVNDRGTAVLYRGILLPYSSDDRTIDFIYGVINWKEMADQQTADELFLAIDQALADPADPGEAFGEEAVETVEALTGSGASDGDDDVLELGNEDIMDKPSFASLPRPSFGQEGADDMETETAAGGRSDRAVDALGNPIGSPAAGSDEDEFDGGMKTAADYGLPDWDDEDFEEDDVDDVVDPLADDEDASSSLISLVSRGAREKKSVDLSVARPAPAIPQAFAPPMEDAAYGYDAFEAGSFDPMPGPSTDAPEEEEADISAEWTATAAESAADDAAPLTEEALDAGDGSTEQAIGGEPGPDGLHDCLAAAREMAQTAQNTEDRSRKALYEAVGRAYDFSIEAQDNPGEYDELLVDNGLTVQDRAPMTPVVKLVFGADYDKTRLTEYAAVLMHAHRVGVERGSLAGFLREAEGGLKGVVQAERRARKEEQGKVVEDGKSVRPALAKKLRALEALSLADLEEEGAEFALVMVRRSSEGGLEVVGEVPEDIALVERAARKLLG